MKLNAIGHNVATNSIHFGNALSTRQEEMKLWLQERIDEYEKKDKTDYSIIKVYQQAFPSAPEVDLGIGYMNSSEAEKIYNKIKVQGGTDVIKFMPFGELTDFRTYNECDRTGPYDRSALSIGADLINIPDLATKKWGNILSKESLNALLEEHKRNGSEDRIDFKTTLGYKNQESIPINDMLRHEVFENFKTKNTPEVKALRKEFNEFKNDEFYDEIFSRTALYPYLKDWGTGAIESIRAKDIKNLDGLENLPNYNEMKAAFESGNPEAVIYQGNLFKNFDYGASETQELLYEKVKENYQDDIDFYKFKQFLASKTVDEGVQMVHDKGMLAFGDAAIGWSWPEVQAFPDAFKWKHDGKIAEAGFQKPALKYEDLLEHQDAQDTPAHKLLRAKQELVLRHFDGVREDVGWQYFKPQYTNSNFHWSDGTQKGQYDVGVSNVIPKYIEQVAREIKGDDFDTGRIIYECDAGGKDFNLQDPETTRAINSVGGKVILSTMHEKQKGNDAWGSLAFILENLGIKAKNIVLQCCNHDGETILEGLNNSSRVDERVGAMMRTLKLPNDQWWKLKDDGNFVEHIHKYVRGRFAEIKSSLTNAILVNELFGMTDRIDYHCRMDDKQGNQKDGKVRWARNWEEQYDMQLTQNKAFNWGDVTNFKAECNGKKNENHKLYEMAEKFAAYESRNDGIHTKEQAENSEFGDLDIINMDLEEIKHLNLSA